MNDKVKKVFSVKPIISFENAKKLSNYLIGAKIYSIGSLQCGQKRWNVSSVTQKHIKLIRLDCDDK